MLILTKIEPIFSGEKRYACANCGRCFALKSYLSKHEDSSCGQGRHGLRARQRASGSNVITSSTLRFTDNNTQN